MSTAHRPTWDPAQARDTKAGSRQFSVRDMPSHTRLKFRQVGQTSSSEVAKRDLKYELLLAEHEAKNKKRKAEGLPLLEFEHASKQPAGAIESGTNSSGGEESNKRRRILEEALEMDRDEEEEEVNTDGTKDKKDDQNADGEEDKDDDDEDDSDDDSDEDDTDELLRELQKIKQERAEEKARQEAAQTAESVAAREAEIATKNPLLNLAAALGQDTAGGVNTTVPGTFSVKRRWDDDLIFKNQALSSREKLGQGQFVNDLLRTEFHKKFMSKFIK